MFVARHRVLFVGSLGVRALFIDQTRKDSS
jgi:hypothetical protein